MNPVITYEMIYDTACAMLVIAVFGGAYFVPSAIAFGRGVTRKWEVFMFNFFLGWTVIGWMGAMVWALCGKRRGL